MDAVRRNQKLPDMTVPKLIATNFEQFNTAFSSVVQRQMSLSGASLSYLLRDDAVGNYDAHWPTREDKLHHCLRLDGSIFKDDSQSLYSLMVQRIGSTGVGSNIVNKFQISKNGRQCHVELKAHFQNNYDDRRNFTLETFYNVMSQAFLELEQSGPVYALSEEQKITRFEGGLAEDKAISYSILAKTQWNGLQPNQKNFDSYYNFFSAYMNKHNSLSASNNHRSRIFQVSGRRGRGHGRSSNRGGRCHFFMS